MVRTSVEISIRVKSQLAYSGICNDCSPAEELKFVTDEDGKDAHDVIYLKNTLPYPIAYKVNHFYIFETSYHVDKIKFQSICSFPFIHFFSFALHIKKHASI